MHFDKQISLSQIILMAVHLIPRSCSAVAVLLLVLIISLGKVGQDISGAV